MKLAKKASALALIVLFALALVTPVEAETRTGQYAGNGTVTQVCTGLSSIQSLTIVSVPVRGPSSFAYTTATIGAFGSGTFINGNKRDTGIGFGNVGCDFTVVTPDFNEAGATYHWEAHGD